VLHNTFKNTLKNTFKHFQLTFGFTKQKKTKKKKYARH